MFVRSFSLSVFSSLMTRWVLEKTLISSENNDANNCSRNIVLLSENTSNLQVFLDRPNDSVAALGIYLAFLTCKMLPQNWIGSSPNFILVEQLDKGDKFRGSRSYVSPGNRILDEALLHTRKARLALINLRHSWCRDHI